MRASQFGAPKTDAGMPPAEGGARKPARIRLWSASETDKADTEKLAGGRGEAT